MARQRAKKTVPKFSPRQFSKELTRIEKRAKKFDREAKRDLKEGLKTSAKMARQDAASLRRFASAVKKKNVKGARTMMRGMDTDTREEIPNRLFNRLGGL